MHIQLVLAEDKATGHPYWSGKVLNEGNVVLEVVSKTFQPHDNYQFERQYESVAMSVMKEIKKTQDLRMLKHLLINN